MDYLQKQKRLAIQANLFVCDAFFISIRPHLSLWYSITSAFWDVDCTTKIRILKQITTNIKVYFRYWWCRLHHKDTNFKANHNAKAYYLCSVFDVDCTTKIRILKQITTMELIQSFIYWCRLHHKDTNFKANHNTKRERRCKVWMSIAPQRYEF